MAPKKSKRVAKTNRSKTVKRRSASKKTGKREKKGTKHFVDIGATRPRITGQTGMTQNMSVTKDLAKSMALSKTKAQGLAQSLARGMGQSLA